LNYDGRGEAKPGKGWYASKSPCNEPYDGLVWNCHEFPFFSTLQGGPSPVGGRAPFIDVIDAADNQDQGRYLRNRFYLKCGIECATGWIDVSDAPLLTEGMLEKLEERWRAQGAPIVQALRPGLDSGALRAAASPLGLNLPTEAQVWWGWHDGTASTLTSHAIGRDILFLSLGAAMDRYEQERAAATAAIGEGIDSRDTWGVAWLPVAAAGDGALIACDCSVAEGAPTPIRYVHWDKVGGDSRAPVAPSLGTVVAWWIEAIDAGAWRYDPERACWEAHPERLPDPAVELTGVV
jgi:cell wall assembly regulator SMI1